MPMFFPIFVAVLTGTVLCQPSHITESAPAQTDFHWDILGSKVTLDENIWDAVMEGTVTLVVFCLCSMLLRLASIGRDRRIPKGKKLMPDTEKATSTAPEVMILEQKAARCWPMPRETRADCADVPTPRQTNPTTTDLEPQALVPLCCMVRSGRAVNIPNQLDRIYKQATAGYCKRAREQCGAHHLLTVLRACASARRFSEALEAYDHSANRVGVGEPNLWSVLLYSAVEAGSWDYGKYFFQRLCALTDPSGHDFVNIVRCFVCQQDLPGLQRMLAELKARGCAIDAFARNKALAACMGKDSVDSARLGFAEALAKVGALDAVGYNTLMKLYAKAGHLDHCFKLRSEMTEQDVKPSEVTFGILLNACVGAGNFDRAKDIFAELCSSGVRLNVVHCTTFIKGLISAKRLHEADDVLHEMSRSPGTKPDLITYSILVKAYADYGNVSAAFSVLKRMLDEDIKPDEIIFNSVLGSCSVGPSEVSQTLSIFNSLLELGLKPSTLTLSILLKALLLKKAWGLAIAFLADCPRKFGLKPEMRLYTQIAQASMKANDSEAAIIAFQTLQDVAALRGETLDPLQYSRLLHQCANTFDSQIITKIRSMPKCQSVRGHGNRAPRSQPQGKCVRNAGEVLHPA